jgi:hypothetical protein
MLGSTKLTQVLGAGIDNTDHEAVRALMRQAADIGLSLLFIYPDSKVPADMRTPRQRKADDKIAQEAAREQGRRDWASVKSAAGLALATSDKTVLDRYLKAYIQQFSEWRYRDTETGQPGDVAVWSKKHEDAEQIMMTRPVAVNLAVEVGGSALVVIDCDTAAQMARWFEVAEIDPAEAPAPTVVTPGQHGEGGDPDDSSTWAHADGGHFYFTVPDELIPVLPRNVGSMTWGGDDGFAVLWDRRYVLIPPSTRPEGAYEQVGDDYPLPEWLFEAIVKAGTLRAERAAEAAKGPANEELGDAIDQWADSISWASILEPWGWTPAPRNDACGCEVWTGPGNHANAKTATCHGGGCSAGRYTERNAPMHFWTDNPDPPFDTWLAAHGTKTISKLQAVALLYFDGNIGKAMDELDLTPAATDVDPDIAPRQRDEDTAPTDGDFELPGLDPAEAQRRENVAMGRRCAVCNSYAGDFAADERGFLWHADDDGGHRADGVITDPRTGDPITTDEGQDFIDRQVGQTDTDNPDLKHDAEVAGEHAIAEAPISLDPADLPADFGKKAPAADPVMQAASPSPYADDVDADPDVFDSQHTGVPRIAPFSHWRDMPPPEYIIDGLIEHGGLSCIIGPPGVGKSTVALDMACHISTGQRWRGRAVLKTRVLYLPGEGLSGAVQRLRAWEEAHGLSLDRDLLLGDSIIQVRAINEAWGEIAAYIARQEIGLVIFDTFARMSSGLEENSATDVGTAVRRFDKLKQLTNAGVMVVHHTGKGDPNSGRGSSALNGALDSELLVRHAQWDTSDITDDQGRMMGKPLELLTTKQKNTEQLEDPIQLMMIDAQDEWGIKAPIITGPTDPNDGDIVMARPLPEPIVETAIRVRDYLDGLPVQGATRTDLVLAVLPDAYARSRNDTGRYWKTRMGEAVDRALRYSLIETLTGTASGSRYIPSGATRESARVAAAAEIGDD